MDLLDFFTLVGLTMLIGGCYLALGLPFALTTGGAVIVLLSLELVRKK